MKARPFFSVEPEPEATLSDIKHRVARSLDAVDAALPLVRLIDDIVQGYPDAYALASEHAARMLKKHTGREMDPRFVWWHQFNTEGSSHVSFNGWRHSGPPQKSLLLAELVIDRFDVYFQEASDELDQRGGFYRQGPHARFFDERNEVPMLGKDVQDDLWATDFGARYRERVETFWERYGADFRVLAKVNLLGRGAKALAEGRILPLDWERLRALASDSVSDAQLPTLDSLRANATRSVLTVNRYVFGEADKWCLFGLQAADGRVMAYMPWSDDAFEAFASEQAMAVWLAAQLRSTDQLDAFVAGTHSNPRDKDARRLIKVILQGIAGSRSDPAALIALTLFKRRVDGDMFSYLGDQAAREMRRNALLMQDNAGLRKAMFSGYLAAFLGVFGGFAPLGWPMSLMLLGASVAKVALDVDAALHASDELTRKSALRAAMLDTVFASMNLLDISFQSSFALLAYEAPPHEVEVALQHWQRAEPATLPPALLESDTLLAGEPVQEGRLRNIHVDDHGICWIALQGRACRVRYSHELAVWLIVSADNPFAFGPIHPVRLNATGEWELLAPLRLLGGAPPTVQGLQSTTSPFWDVYAVLNDARSKQLSAYVLQRQKALLKRWPIAELERGRAPDLDQRGMDCVMVKGRPYYGYRYGREYFNTLIEYYTSDEARVNDVFRSGLYKYGDEDAFIGDLVDSLELLPESNQASMYRGGHRSRGTGGERYRTGELQVGDVLVNTDLTSFTENPYKAIEFACQLSTQAPSGMPGLFDDSSVIFELPAGDYRGTTPISAFSLYWDEAESLLVPGHYFRIEKLEQVYGEHYRFVKVTLKQVAKPASGELHDLRTGAVFDLAAYRARFKTPALVERFFPG